MFVVPAPLFVGIDNFLRHFLCGIASPQAKSSGAYQSPAGFWGITRRIRLRGLDASKYSLSHRLFFYKRCNRFFGRGAARPVGSAAHPSYIRWCPQAIWQVCTKSGLLFWRFLQLIHMTSYVIMQTSHFPARWRRPCSHLLVPRRPGCPLHFFEIGRI